MPQLTESQRQVIESRIQGAGAQEQSAIAQFLGAGTQGLGQAPDIASILQMAQRFPQQEIDTLRRSVFSGVSAGVQPQLEQALQFAREQGGARGLPQSTIAAALQAQAVPQVLAPALAQAQSQFAGLLPTAFNRPLQQAQLASGLRGQAFGELQAALSRNLQERSHNVTKTSRTFKPQGPSPFARILGGALGTLAGGFLGPLGGALAGRFLGGFGGGDSTSIPVGQMQSVANDPSVGATKNFATVNRPHTVPPRAVPVPINIG